MFYNMFFGGSEIDDSVFFFVKKKKKRFFIFVPRFLYTFTLVYIFLVKWAL